MKGLFLLLLAASVAADDGGTRHLRYQRPVLLNATATGQTCMAVPPDVFPHAAQYLHDLRLFQGEREVPYALRVDARPSTGTLVRPVKNLGTVRGDTVFEADPPPGDYDQVTLGITAHDFIATVTVTGTHDAQGSAPVTLGSFTVFDLSGQKLGRSTVLHLPQSNFQHLRFAIKGRVKPEEVTGITFAPESTADGTLYMTAVASGQLRKDGRHSVLDVAVPPHMPVDRIVFVPGPGAPAAFSRDVTVTESLVDPTPPPEDEQPLTMHVSGNLQRVHRQEEGRRVDVETLMLATDGTPAGAATKWHIEVENGDDVPLPIEQVLLQMRQRDVCFDNTGGSPYTLYYGDERRAAPSYDYNRLFSPEPHPARASLGSEQENAGYEPRADSRPFSERHPALLWVGLLLTVGVLGAVALRTARAAPGARD